MRADGALRAAVVATGRAMLAEGLVAGSEGNVSARSGDVLHITPAGLGYGEMTAADLVTLDLAGAIVAGALEPSSERRVHLAIYAARPDAGAIVHTHSPAAITWSLRDEDLALGERGPIRTAARAAPGSSELAEVVLAALGGGRAALMAGHGAVTLGPDLAGALDVARAVEEAAAARSGGG